jgi:prevent-host-death family protein
MSNQYSIAQARDRLASLVHDVENGVSVELTRRGKRVAVLISIDEYNRLVAGNSSLWQALEKFRQQTNLEEVGIEPEIFEGIRDSAPGREVVW